MKVYLKEGGFIATFRTQVWRLPVFVLVALLVGEVTSLNGSHVCNVKQKYNVTKRVKYRAPMYVRTYEWCFAMPPRCSRWTTEMRDLTRLETEERTAEVAICCPGYKMKDIACVPICPNGKTGPGCADDCPKDKWGPNCVNQCTNCSNHGTCSPINGNCICRDEWKGESCNLSTPATTSRTINDLTLTSTYLNTLATNSSVPSSTMTSESETSSVLRNSFTTQENPKIIPSTSETTAKTNTYYIKSKSTTPSFTTEVIKQIDNTEYIPVSTTKVTFDTYLESSTYVTPAINSGDTITKKNTDFKSSTTLTTHKAVEPTSTLKPEVITSKPSQPTTRFKPKEIWIKPAQKGESSLIDSKLRESLNLRPKTTKKDVPLDNTTPRTIIVSIIPTSIAYTTFKKIHLTTSPFQRETNETQRPHESTNISTKGMRKPSTSHTSSTPTSSLFTLKLLSTSWTRNKLGATTVNPLLFMNITYSKSISSATESTLLSFTKTNSSTVSNSKTFSTNSLIPSPDSANTARNVSFYNTLTTKFLTNTTRTYHTELLQTSTATNTVVSTPSTTKKSKVAPRSTTQNFQVTTHRNPTSSGISTKHSSNVKETVSKIEIETTIADILASTLTSNNVTDNSLTITNSATEKSTLVEDETFHILTEPEHITAVIGDKVVEKNSLDLLSVLSIAGGVMMSVITVAVVVVMLERCKRPRYEQVRKVNDIRMKVIMESSDVPPPYMRSIFHTPLPDPPTNEKCHYQPISTLDRNLKQFMRPVVVQAISPAMLENFRGIIECHYDHLPRRSYDNEVVPKPFTAPSRSSTVEPTQSQAPFVDSTIEALKCEAKFDVIDTTSEPLYAEIPCWRPRSEHAIEIVNFNGEAITEL